MPRQANSSGRRTKLPPATTPEARELQMVNLAFDVAESQLLEGTASAQVITHLLKLGSSRNQKEMEKLQADLDKARAQIKHMEQSSQGEAKLDAALKAFRRYSGQNEEDSDEDEDVY